MDRIGIDDDFFACGGHSLRLTRLVWRIHEKLGVDVPIRTVFQYPTVAALAAQLSADTEADFEGPVRRPAADPRRAPLWWLHAGWRVELALPGIRPSRRAVLAAVRHPGTRLRRHSPGPAGSIEEMVEDYLGQVLQVQPSGPYHLLGWSFGGTLAHAMAAELQRRGHEVALLALLDAAPSSHFADLEARQGHGPPLLANYMGHLAGMEEYPSLVTTASSIFIGQMEQMRRFTSPRYRGDVVFNALLDPETHDKRELDEELDVLWQEHVDGRVQRIDIACAHNEMYWPRNTAAVSRAINRYLRAAQ